MKRFPINILFFSIFLPPVCYVLTLQTLEGFFHKRETSRLNHLIIRNYKALYEGLYPVSEEIRRNIGDHLSQSIKYKLGVRTQIMIKTMGDRILYPTRIGAFLSDSSGTRDDSQLSKDSPTYVDIAADNYRILNEGLVVSVGVQIKHNTWLANRPSLSEKWTNLEDKPSIVSLIAHLSIL